MDPVLDHKKLIRFSILSFIETFGILFYMLFIPVSIKNQTNGVLGYSGFRWFVFIGLAILLISFSLVCYSAQKKNSLYLAITRNINAFSNYTGLFNLNVFSSLCSLFFFYLIIKWLTIEKTPQNLLIIIRILPVLILALLLSTQFFIIFRTKNKFFYKSLIQNITNYFENAINPRSVLKDLLFLSFLLIVINILGQWIRFFSPYKVFVDFIINEFYVNNENNIPTLFSTFLLLFSSMLLFFHARKEKDSKGNFAFQWYLLAIGFAFLGFDEYFQYHEKLTEPVRNTLNTTGLLSFAWYIPIIPLLILLGIYYLKFVLHLPNKYKIGFSISGLCYISGTIGMEMIGSNHAYNYGLGNMNYALLASVEETFEMLGVILFIYFLIDLFQRKIFIES